MLCNMPYFASVLTTKSKPLRVLQRRFESKLAGRGVARVFLSLRTEGGIERRRGERHKDVLFPRLQNSRHLQSSNKSTSVKHDFRVIAYDTICPFLVTKIAYNVEPRYTFDLQSKRLQFLSFIYFLSFSARAYVRKL